MFGDIDNATYQDGLTQVCERREPEAGRIDMSRHLMARSANRPPIGSRHRIVFTSDRPASSPPKLRSRRTTPRRIGSPHLRRGQGRHDVDGCVLAPLSFQDLAGHFHRSHNDLDVLPCGVAVRVISGRAVSSTPPGPKRRASPAVVVTAMRRVWPRCRFTPTCSARGRSCFSNAASQVWPTRLLQRPWRRPRTARRPPIAAGMTCSLESSVAAMSPAQ